MHERIVGIDIGTSSCSVALVDGGIPRVLPVFDGHDEMPTYVAFRSDGTQLVGLPAKRQKLTNPANTIFTVKRLIGRKLATAADELGLLPYRVTSSATGTLWIEAAGRTYTPTEITAMMLGEVRRATEAYIGHTLTKAVITVPAQFDLGQIRATVDAARIAGIDVLRTISEPVAAALAYGHANRAMSACVAVYDLGGGTFDVSILEMSDGVYEVIAVNGDNRLGGEDFDHFLVGFFVKQFRREFGVDLSGDALALHRIKEASERIKIRLDTESAVVEELPYLSVGGRVYNAELKITRAELETLFEPLIARTIGPCANALSDSGRSPAQIDRLVLVGGMSRMPAVRARVAEFFDTTPTAQLDPSRIVAMGAAIQAAVLDGNVTDQLVLDVTPLTLGMEKPDGTFVSIIGRNTTIPTKAQFTVGVRDAGDDALSLCLTAEEWAALAGKGLCIAQSCTGASDDRLILFEHPLQIEEWDKDYEYLEIVLDVDASFETYLAVYRRPDRALVVERERLEARNPFGSPQSTDGAGLAAARAQADILLNQVDAAVADASLGAHPVRLAQIGEARTDLTRAMQSRDLEALSQAIDALSVLSRVSVPIHVEELPVPIAMAATPTAGPSVFISYARADKKWLERLLIHLQPLVRGGRVTVWHDGKIEPGAPWKHEIEGALASASAVVLIVSANFMASDFIYANELPPILARRARDGLNVYPVIVSNSQFERDPLLSELGAFNDPKVPLSAMRKAAAEAQLARLVGLLPGN